MIIKKIEVFPLRWTYPAPISDARSKIVAKSALILRVWDSNGMYGWGEAATFGDIPELVANVINIKLAPMIIEKSVAPKSISDYLLASTAHFGQKGLIVSAISGIEIALWDLLGKLSGQPVASLLGGDLRPIRVYASTGYYKNCSDPKDDIQKLQEDLRTADLNDFSGVKIKIGKYGIRDDIRRISMARKILGDDCLLIADANNALTVREAIDLTYAIKDKNVLFIEEPIPFGNPQESRRLRDLAQIPIGGYELEFGLEGYLQYIENSSVDYLQPDCIWSGGIFKCLLIAEYAKRKLIKIVPHNFSTIVALAANMHLLCASGTDDLIEYDNTGNPFMTNISQQRLLPTNGFIHISSESGLGVEVDEKLLEQYLIS